MGIVGEVLRGKQTREPFLLEQRDVGADARLLYGRYVLPRAVGRVGRDRARLQAPSEATPEEQLLHGEALVHLRRGDQHVQDHPRLAPIHDVMGLVAERADAPLLLVHGRGVGVGGAYPEVGHPLVAASDRAPILAPILLDPAVPLRVRPRQLAALFAVRGPDLGEDPVSVAARFLGKDLRQVVLQLTLQERPRARRVQRRVRLHLGGVDEQLLAPHESCLDAFLDDPLEEAPKDPQTEALLDPSEARVVGQRLEEVGLRFCIPGKLGSPRVLWAPRG